MYNWAQNSSYYLSLFYCENTHTPLYHQQFHEHRIYYSVQYTFLSSALFKSRFLSHKKVSAKKNSNRLLLISDLYKKSP